MNILIALTAGLFGLLGAVMMVAMPVISIEYSLSPVLTGLVLWPVSVCVPWYLAERLSEI